jgi:hypothetical protein
MAKLVLDWRHSHENIFAETDCRRLCLRHRHAMTKSRYRCIHLHQLWFTDYDRGRVGKLNFVHWHLRGINPGEFDLTLFHFLCDAFFFLDEGPSHHSLKAFCATPMKMTRMSSFFYQFLHLMEHQWNEIDRGNPTTRRKTCPSATLWRLVSSQRICELSNNRSA